MIATSQATYEIVHEGSANGDGYLELSDGGGLEAMDTAAGVVEWFGLAAGFDGPPPGVVSGQGVIPPCAHPDEGT